MTVLDQFLGHAKQPCVSISARSQPRSLFKYCILFLWKGITKDDYKTIRPVRNFLLMHKECVHLIESYLGPASYRKVQDNVHMQNEKSSTNFAVIIIQMSLTLEGYQWY